MRSALLLARRLSLAILSVVLVDGPVVAESIAGWIEGFDGEPEQYVILRSGQRVKAAIFMPLLEGDEVSVGGVTGRLRMALGDGASTSEVGPGSGPYVVKAARVPTLPTNLMRWATGWFTGWHQARQSQVVAVHVRGGRPIFAPPFEGTPGMLQAGTRSVFLTWTGGKPPYEVSLVREGSETPLLSLKGVGQSRVRVDNVTLVPATYILTVEDGAGGQDRAKLIVAPVNQVPAPPDELARSALAPAARTTLLAAWLAAHDDGLWVFEAYQQAALVATPGSAAELLREALERGERPTEPGN